MKMPIKKFIPKPTKTVQRFWYPYHNYETNCLIFKEYSEKDSENDDLSSQDSLSISDINTCVNLIIEKYKIRADEIVIKSIILDSGEDDTTIEFGFSVRLSDEEFAAQMAEYDRKQNEQDRKLAEWEEFNKAKKIEDLKRELEKLQKA